MALVLCIGGDDTLLRTRRLILEEAGHTVVSASRVPQVKAACSQNNFDVAVIGQTLAGNEKLRVLGVVRKHCRSAKILELYASHLRRVLSEADDWLAVPLDVPPELAERVAALARRQED